MSLPQLLNRVTPRRKLPEELAAVSMSRADRARAHMLASLLLDYPSEEWFARLDLLEQEALSLNGALADLYVQFIARARDAGPLAWQRDYVVTFDMKRKCSLYLSYFAAGDTRKRGTALVTFIEAYRAAGWKVADDELPDFLPAVLEFSAKSDDPIAEALLAAHIEGVEVLRKALEDMESPWAGVVRAVTLSLPPVDQETRERVLALVNEGPPTETVGLSFLGNLPPFQAREDR